MFYDCCYYYGLSSFYDGNTTICYYLTLFVYASSRDCSALSAFGVRASSVYWCLYIRVCVYIYIYIYIIHMCVYIYIYIYMHVELLIDS